MARIPATGLKKPALAASVTVAGVVAFWTSTPRLFLIVTVAPLGLLFIVTGYCDLLTILAQPVVIAIPAHSTRLVADFIIRSPFISRSFLWFAAQHTLDLQPALA